MQSSAARASLWWDEQHQSRKMIGVKDFRVVPDSLMLQSFLWANLFEIFFLFLHFFLQVRVQAWVLFLDSSLPMARQQFLALNTQNTSP